MQDTAALKQNLRFLKRQLGRQPLLFARVAETLVQLGKHKQALQILNKGLFQHPNYVSGWLVKGNLHISLRQDDRARDSFRRALEADQIVPYAHDRCAEYAHQAGDLADYHRHLQDIAYLDSLDGNIQTMIQTVMLRRIAVENGVFSKEEVERLMPGTLRQALLKHNLIPNELERNSRRWTVATQEVAPLEADVLTEESPSEESRGSLFTKDEELRAEDDQDWAPAEPRHDAGFDEDIIGVIPKETELQDGEDWLGERPTRPKSFSTAKGDWAQKESEAHTRIDWAETASAKTETSPYIKVDPEAEFEKAPEVEPEAGEEDASSYEDFDDRFSGDRSAILEEEPEEAESEREDGSDAGSRWEEMKQKVLEESEAEEEDTPPSEIQYEPPTESAEEQAPSEEPEPAPPVRPPVGSGRMDVFRGELKAQHKAPELENIPASDESPEKPTSGRIERGQPEWEAQAEAKQPPAPRKPPVVERAQPEPEKREAAAEQPPVEVRDEDDSPTSEPSEPLSPRRQALVNMLRETASKEKPVIERGIPGVPEGAPAAGKKSAKEAGLGDLISKIGAAKPSAAPTTAADKAIAPEARKKLADVASEVTGVKPKAAKTDKDTSAKEQPKKIATKTLAELYASQGDWAKAINVYEELLQRFPTNEAYKQRVKELRSRADAGDNS